MHYRELLDRVIDQAERRVFKGESVPAAEKMHPIGSAFNALHHPLSSNCMYYCTRSVKE